MCSMRKPVPQAATVRRPRCPQHVESKACKTKEVPEERVICTWSPRCDSCRRAFLPVKRSQTYTQPTIAQSAAQNCAECCMLVLVRATQLNRLLQTRPTSSPAAPSHCRSLSSGRARNCASDRHQDGKLTLVEAVQSQSLGLRAKVRQLRRGLKRMHA